ncbi:MAG: formylglycine-generating enzyme family protein, partial [Cyanobacteria bacterium J06641_2]
SQAKSTPPTKLNRQIPKPQLNSQTSINFSRRKTLQILASVGGGFIGAILGQRIWEFSSNGYSNNLKSFDFETVTVNASGNVINRESNSAKYFTEDLGNGVTLDMVQIPGGEFLMGSPSSEEKRQDDESPQHKVNIKPFYMGKFAVTQAQYQAIMGENPSRFKGNNRPVETVSWNDATEFCQKLTGKTGRTYRLPSEAEWEYACRAGTTTSFHFGETITTKLANYDGTTTYANEPRGEYRKQTTEVGNFPRNAFGFCDMHGNVWEWCQDTWHDNYNGAPTDGSAWIENGNDSPRVLRGGSWKNNPGFCRSAFRYYSIGRGAFDDLFGFRVVCVSGRDS